MASAPARTPVAYPFASRPAMDIYANPRPLFARILREVAKRAQALQKSDGSFEENPAFRDVGDDQIGVVSLLALQ
ncbi:MAG: hypothetical protein KY468_18530, partial [Armatimonadetes bacterium]|nr:hypothetical protein [Armatimonadota bacterium]